MKTTSQTSTSDYPIAITDQASKSILLFEASGSDWNCEEALRMTYKLPDGLDRPNDVKLRDNSILGRCLVISTVQSAAIVSYPDCKVKWSRYIGGNPHSAELLPNGNIAIAGAKGGFVRVYASSQGADSSVYAEFPLHSAHGVQWDPKLEVLWALGNDKLVALKVMGTSAHPAIEEWRQTTLPTRDGHDLSSVIGNADRLWVTSGTKVYQYIKSQNAFDSDFPDHDRISMPGVKCIGNQPSGQVVLNQPKPGVLHWWNTDTVQFVSPDGTRTRDGVAFYKARILNPSYI